MGKKYMSKKITYEENPFGNLKLGMKVSPSQKADLIIFFKSALL
jgi:hypothetical protein